MYRLTPLTLALLLALAGAASQTRSQETPDGDSSGASELGFPLDPLGDSLLPGTEPDEKVVFLRDCSGRNGSPPRADRDHRAERPDVAHLLADPTGKRPPTLSESRSPIRRPSKLTGPFRPDREPYRHDDTIYPGVPIEEFDGTVVFTAPIELAAEADPEGLAVEVFF